MEIEAGGRRRRRRMRRQGGEGGGRGGGSPPAEPRLRKTRKLKRTDDSIVSKRYSVKGKRDREGEKDEQTAKRES